MAAPVAIRDVATHVEHDGFAILAETIGPTEISTILSAVQRIGETLMQAPRGGARALFEHVPEIRTLALDGLVREAAAAVVGPEVAARSTPVALSAGVLSIKADGAAWASELRITLQAM